MDIVKRVDGDGDEHVHKTPLVGTNFTFASGSNQPKVDLGINEEEILPSFSIKLILGVILQIPILMMGTRLSMIIPIV